MFVPPMTGCASEIGHRIKRYGEGYCGACQKRYWCQGVCSLGGADRESWGPPRENSGMFLTSPNAAAKSETVSSSEDHVPALQLAVMHLLKSPKEWRPTSLFPREGSDSKV